MVADGRALNHTLADKPVPLKDLPVRQAQAHRAKARASADIHGSLDRAVATLRDANSLAPQF